MDEAGLAGAFGFADSAYRLEGSSEGGGEHKIGHEAEDVAAERAPQHTAPVAKPVKSSHQSTKTKVAATQGAGAQKPKTTKEPPRATLDPEYITFNAWVEKVADVHYNALAEDRNLEYCQTQTLSKYKTNVCKHDIMRVPPMHAQHHFLPPHG